MRHEAVTDVIELTTDLGPGRTGVVTSERTALQPTHQVASDKRRRTGGRCIVPGSD